MLQGDSLKRVQTGRTTRPSRHRIGSARNLSSRTYRRGGVLSIGGEKEVKLAAAAGSSR